MGGAVTVDLSTGLALVKDDVSFFGVGFHANGLHLSAARVCPVTWIDVNVQGPKAEGAVIARGVPQRFDLFATVLTDKAVVVFGKSFLLHFDLLKINKLDLL